ncbi:MAG: PIN domain-containing protein [Bryobacteraceae bacterium]|nr:PIN domain-containing protein [Bryobacteraceae bacterium]
MIGVDTNVWIAYFAGDESDDIHLLSIALRFGQALMPPPVTAELLSQADFALEDRGRILRAPKARLMPGFWERAGETRAALIRLGHRPRLADTLIAQVCIDHDIPLLTRDRGFTPFAKHSGLHLAK